MNILIVTPWYKPTIGGVVLYIERLGRILTEYGHKVSILIPGDSDTVSKSGQDDVIPVYTFNMRPFLLKSRPLKSLAAFVFYFIPTIARLRRFLKEAGVQVVLISYPSNYEFYFAILKKLFSIKYCVLFHGSDINFLAEQHWAVRKSVNFLVGSADGLVAASAGLLSKSRENLKVLPKSSRVIYMGIDEGWKTDSHYSPRLKGNYILTLAWATQVKGPDVAIRAFERISHRHLDVNLVMVGSGPMEEELRLLIDSLGLRDRIIRLGTVESSALPAIFKKALFGIIPSRYEGFPMVPIEFQYMKKAIIASAVGGIPEFVTDKYNGILVPPDDIEALADRMEELLDNPQLCEEMGRRGYDRVMESFTIRRTGENFIKLLEEILFDKS